jgi:pimeloyl-ACP methyl ester carboxylesterase
MSLHEHREGSGPPLVLVHGLGGSGLSWAPVLPSLAAEREVIAPDLPGFGQSEPLPGEVSIATLTDALADYLKAAGLESASIVGSSMGARMVLELVRRGVAGGDVVALNPGGFWSPAEKRYFRFTVGPSLRLVGALQPAMPVLTGNPVTRSLLFAQFSARPWTVPGEVALREARGLIATSVQPAYRALSQGPLQEGAPAGSARGRLTLGWGRKDRLTPPRQAARATDLFPDAELVWFERSGHLPHWDEPAATARLILERTA